MPNEQLTINASAPRRGGLNRALDFLEAVGNRLPDQSTIFVALAVGTLVASAIASGAGWSVTHPITGATIQPVNLLSRDGMQWVLANVVRNFAGFAPLGTVLVAMIGVGVAERTGLFAALMKLIVTAAPHRFATPAVVFVGTLSHIAADAGFVIVPPLAAMLFHSLRRHPLVGVAAAMAGVAGGFSATVVLCALDPLLSGLTQEAAQTLDPTVKVHAAVNYYFLAASVPLLTVVGWIVADRFVEPRLGPWRPELLPRETMDGPEQALTPLTSMERRGLWAALVGVLVVLSLIATMVIPENGVLRKPREPGAPAADWIKTYSPLFDSLVALLLGVFIVPGVVYGVVTGQVRSDKDAARMMRQTISTMGGYIVLAFFAAQFIEWFKKSNLGLFLSIAGADWLRAMHVSGAPLLISFIVLVAAFNLLMCSASAKWALVAPIVVPMFMQLGYSPEATQAVYRVGASCTNPITPLNPYFPIVIAVAQRYVPRAGMGTLISLMVPFSLAYLVTWTAFAVAWILLELPVGPGAALHYPAAP